MACTLSMVIGGPEITTLTSFTLKVHAMYTLHVTYSSLIHIPSQSHQLGDGEKGMSSRALSPQRIDALEGAGVEQVACSMGQVMG